MMISWLAPREINKILKTGRAWDKNKDRRTRARSKKQEEVALQWERGS